MPQSKLRIGQGYDVHQLVPDRVLILGGVEIKYETGLAGHSDADVLIHSICDACLGAIAVGDIGKHFPDSDTNYKDADSRILLRKVTQLLVESGYSIVNLDATVIAEQPKLAPYIEAMRHNISKDLNCEINQVSVKATTTEGLGFTGEQLGIAAMSVVLLETS